MKDIYICNLTVTWLKEKLWNKNITYNLKKIALTLCLNIYTISFFTKHVQLCASPKKWYLFLGKKTLTKKLTNFRKLDYLFKFYNYCCLLLLNITLIVIRPVYKLKVQMDNLKRYKGWNEMILNNQKYWAVSNPKIVQQNSLLNSVGYDLTAFTRSTNKISHEC